MVDANQSPEMDTPSQSCYSKMPKPSWYKTRLYKHFDNPLSCSAAVAIVTDPKAVESHAFYPFISFDIKSERFRKHKRQKPKIRQIRMAAHSDSHIFAYYAHLLSNAYTSHIKGKPFDKSVLAYRRNLGSNIHFAKDAIEEIRARINCVAIALDLTNFFESLDHEILKRNWCKVFSWSKLPSDHYAVFRAISHYSIVDRDKCYAALGHINSKGQSEIDPKLSRICSPQEFRNKVRKSGLVTCRAENFGIPQGSPISAVLSNVYMLDFDAEMHEHMQKIGGSYRRYCDDILLIIPGTDPLNCEAVCRDTLKKYGAELKVNEAKTVVSIFKDGQLVLSDKSKLFQYLGFTFNGQVAKFRSSTVSKYYGRMIRAIRAHKKNAIKKEAYTSQSDLYRREIYRKHSHLGKRNIFSYVRRSSKLMDDVADVKSQFKKHMGRIKEEIEK